MPIVPSSSDDIDFTQAATHLLPAASDTSNESRYLGVAYYVWECVCARLHGSIRALQSRRLVRADHPLRLLALPRLRIHTPRHTHRQARQARKSKAAKKGTQRQTLCQTYAEQRQVHAIEKSLDALVQSVQVSSRIRKLAVEGQKVRRSGGQKVRGVYLRRC